MKKLLLFIPFILVVLAGCQTKDVIEDKVTACEPPNMVFETGCCLDQNNNSICDGDETKAENATQETDLVLAPRIASNKPEEVRYCNISYAIAWPKYSNNCIIQGTNVNFRLMFSGKGSKLDGLWFYATTKSGEEKYLKESTAFKAGESKEYIVYVGEPITKLIALPIIIEDGTEKACLNQRMIVIGSGVCA